MKPDHTKLAQEWITIAQDDLVWAKDTLTNGHYARACFVCQQVAEKSLKGYLYPHNLSVKTHSLVRLLESCASIDQQFETLKGDIIALDPYYIETRYPDIGDIERYNREELAKEALAAAKKVLDFVKEKIN